MNRYGGKEAPRPSVDELLSNGAARLRAMIEASVDCVITIDAQSTILEFNAAAERTFGYPRNHVIGKPLTEAIIPPVLREDHLRGIAALLRGENGKLLGQRVEMPAMRSDGSEFPVELTITRIGSQSPPLFTAYLRDITEQKRAEEELSQSLTLLRAITEGTTDAVFAKDRQGRYVLFNTAAARFVNKSVDEVIGLDDTSLFSPETAARIRERDRFVLESGETRTDEDVTTSLAGTFRIYLTTKGPLRDASGAITGLFGIGRDITARKEAEEKLRKSETRFRELAENIDEVFWVWTANLGSARLLYVNPAYATIWGRSCEDLYSSPQSWQEALHPEDKEPVLAAIAEFDLEKMSELTYRIVRPDQSIRWISDRVFPRPRRERRRRSIRRHCPRHYRKQDDRDSAGKRGGTVPLDLQERGGWNLSNFAGRKWVSEWHRYFLSFGGKVLPEVLLKEPASPENHEKATAHEYRKTSRQRGSLDRETGTRPGVCSPQPLCHRERHGGRGEGGVSQPAAFGG